jgi:hypothetical protein
MDLADVLAWVDTPPPTRCYTTAAGSSAGVTNQSSNAATRLLLSLLPPTGVTEQHLPAAIMVHAACSGIVAGDAALANTSAPINWER